MSDISFDNNPIRLAILLLHVQKEVRTQHALVHVLPVQGRSCGRDSILELNL